MITATVFYLSSPFMPDDWKVTTALAIDVVLEFSGTIFLLGLLLGTI